MELPFSKLNFDASTKWNLHMKRRKGFNNKRKLQSGSVSPELLALVDQVTYGGNPEHKRNPGNFGLKPPADPRPYKTLCDDCGIFDVAIAESLLRSGLERGFTSQQMKGRWPQNIWAVTDKGYPVEAQLENKDQGTYHGYPMPESDPMRDIIYNLWFADVPKGGTDNAF